MPPLAEAQLDFATEFDQRLQVLSRVQGLLTGLQQGAFDLRSLVEAELAAHSNPDKVTVEGPAVLLPVSSAQTLALALHELMTNAVKYGALGQPVGSLTVSWHVDEREEEQRVALEWKESGLRLPDGAPQHKGYGSHLIERALPYQLGAETRLAFEPDGVRCTVQLTVPGAKHRA